MENLIDLNTENHIFDAHSIQRVPTPKSTSQNFKFVVGFADLPPELFLQIFESMRPTFTSVGPLRRRGHKAPFAAKTIAVHQHALRRYANLRLICSSLNQVLTPIVYREMIVYISGATRLERIVSRFEWAADHLRRLVIFGEPIGDRLSSYEEASQVVGRGMGLCSQVERLECYGNHHVFPNRGWLGRMVPNLASTVTSLVFSMNFDAIGMDLPYSLIGLGPHLRSLEIQYWVHKPKGLPFHLPSEMPHLTNLILRGGYPDVGDVKKLITRAAQRKKTPGDALRSLSILDLSTVGGLAMMDILSINNLGFQLTVLHWHPRYNAQGSVTNVIRACPNLVDFSYTIIVDKDIFQHLPLKLEHLLLYMCSPSEDPSSVYVSSSDDFVTYLKSGRCPALRTLTILIGEKYGGVADQFLPIAPVCNSVGVTLLLLDEAEAQF